MAFPVALAVGVIDLLKMLFAKKKAVNEALTFLQEAGLNLDSFKRCRAKLDASVDKNADEPDPTKRECVVLEPDEAAALDFALDHLSKALQATGHAIGI
jgi:hypothetical protein